MAIACVACLQTACVHEPAEFVADLEAALSTGDVQAVMPLLTVASRPLVGALVQVRGKAGAGLKVPRTRAAVKSLSQQGTRLVLQVQADGLERDWMLVQEGGNWRLDLLETAVRRPWNAP